MAQVLFVSRYLGILFKIIDMSCCWKLP